MTFPKHTRTAEFAALSNELAEAARRCEYLETKLRNIEFATSRAALTDAAKLSLVREQVKDFTPTQESLYDFNG